MSQLPPSWTNTPLLAVSDLLRGVTYTKDVAASLPAPGRLPVLRANNLQGRAFDLSDLVYVPSALVSEQQRIRAGDVVIATSSGSISVVGKAVQSRRDMDAGFGAFCGLLRPATAVDSRYFGHFFSTETYRSRVSAMARGSNINNLKREHFESLSIPVAPHTEQQRIAEKLDTVLARVDACRDRLARVAPLLKRFRQSVLAAATSGQLTKGWNESPLSDLRRSGAAWLDTDLRACIKRMTGGASPSSDDYTRTGVLVLNKGDIKPYGQVRLREPANRLPIPIAVAHEGKLVRNGALLVTLRDLSNKADFLGLIGIYLGSESALLTQGMYSLEVHDAVVPAYLMYFSNSPIYRAMVKREKVGATQVHLRNDQLLDMPIALPPKNEQVEIVRRIETLFSFADRLEARLAQAQTAVDRLTPSLLAKAFRGELVPQDPADEPAAELLKRLEASRTAAAPKPRKARQGQPA